MVVGACGFQCGTLLELERPEDEDEVVLGKLEIFLSTPVPSIVLASVG